jgi:predicted YcjX-like family ATPase
VQRYTFQIAFLELFPAIRFIPDEKSGDTASIWAKPMERFGFFKKTIVLKPFFRE